MAPKAKAFGLRVVTHDPYVSADVLGKAGVESVGFDELLAMSDFVSIHAPLLPATRGLFNAEVFRKMKKGALLINTARGPLVDETALIAALDSGYLGGAALDVVTTEPLAQDSKLLGRDNVILTRTPRSIRSRRSTSCRPNARPTWHGCSPASSRSIR